MLIYGLMRIYGHIFCIYDITCPYGLLNSSYLLYGVTPYVSNFLYIIFYGLLVPCTTQCYILFHSKIFLYLPVRIFVLYFLRWCLITNTLMWSLYASWFEGQNIHILFVLISLYLICLIYFLIGMTPMIMSLNFLKKPTCQGLVMKSLIILFWGRHSTLNTFLMIHSLMKKKNGWCAWCTCYMMNYHFYPG